MSVRLCVCDHERDIHAAKERRGRWVRGACTNTKCECRNFQEAEEVVDAVDSRVFTDARDRIAKAVAAEFDREVDDDAGHWYRIDAGHWYRIANAVLALFPADRVAQLFPEEGGS